jgi:hypothetical protein
VGHDVARSDFRFSALDRGENCDLLGDLIDRTVVRQSANGFQNKLLGGHG